MTNVAINSFQPGLESSPRSLNLHARQKSFVLQEGKVRGVRMDLIGLSRQYEAAIETICMSGSDMKVNTSREA